MRNLIALILVTAFASSAFGQTAAAPAYDKNGRKMDAPILLKDQTTTSAAPSGYKSLYPKADGKLYFKNSANIETAVGSGTGGGGVLNFISNNGDAESDLSGCVLVNGNAQTTSSSSTVDELGDAVNVNNSLRFRENQKIQYAAGTTAIGGLTSGAIYYVKNLVGNSSSMSFQLSSTRGGAAIDLTSDGSGTQDFFAIEPGNGQGGTTTSTFKRDGTDVGDQFFSALNGNASFLYQKTGSGKRGEYIYCPFTLPKSHQGKALDLIYDSAFPAAGNTFSVSGILPTDFTSSVVNLCNNTLAMDQGDIGLHLTPSLTDRRRFVSTTGCANYALAFSYNGVSSTSFFFQFDDLKITPQYVPRGDVIQTEYVCNNSGITAANATDTTSFVSACEAGVPIGSINSATSNSFTTFHVQFSNNTQSGDELALEILDPGDASNAWIPVGANLDVFNSGASVGSPNLFFGAGLSRSTLSSRSARALFGNRGRNSLGSLWSDVSTWRWRLKRTRVIKNVVMSSETNGREQAAGAFPNGGQSIATGVLTKLTWANSQVDTNAMLDTANGRVNIKEDGTYLVYAKIQFERNAGTTPMPSDTQICVNTTSCRSTYSPDSTAKAGDWGTLKDAHNLDVVTLKKNDFVEVFAHQRSGQTVSINLQSRFVVFKIGGAGQTIAQDAEAIVGPANARDKMLRARITFSSTGTACSIASQNGWIASVASGGSQRCNLTFLSSLADKPTCSLTSEMDGIYGGAVINLTTTSLQVRENGANDGTYALLCLVPR